jgi:GntR family transcriptional regulator
VDVDRFSDVPPYRQVGAILCDRIRAGEITDRLPSARDLAAEFGIAPFTALKALRLVREWGYAKVSQGMGTWVSDRADWPDD